MKTMRSNENEIRRKEECRILYIFVGLVESYGKIWVFAISAL